jgi:hypothetical protein
MGIKGLEKMPYTHLANIFEITPPGTASGGGCGCGCVENPKKKDDERLSVVPASLQQEVLKGNARASGRRGRRLIILLGILFL